MTEVEFLIKYDELLTDKQKHTYDSEYVWSMYHSKVEPFLEAITEARIGDSKVRLKEICMVLRVSVELFRVMRMLFEELDFAVESYRDVMKFKSALDIQRGIVATEWKNAKMIEMANILHNDDYKPKGKEVEVSLPKIEIEFVDASIDESELE